ncbi:hypothetical protein NPIL_272741 [Nephila pilipes]|uniref:Uncharacterized protein n=1 Tax=Nephila pilipes TaxID=299642 RepID=A0A8X6QY78_NEPPI|nr:hypothetical protein NPIL_272741 [Nephila pilipes]
MDGQLDSHPKTLSKLSSPHITWVRSLPDRHGSNKPTFPGLPQRYLMGLCYATEADDNESNLEMSFPARQIESPQRGKIVCIKYLIFSPVDWNVIMQVHCSNKRDSVVNNVIGILFIPLEC